MHIVFSHGKESGPWGTKIHKLASCARELGCTVESVDYRDLLDPDKRVRRLTDILDQNSQPCILVGSSMGGYVSLVSAIHPSVMAVFLMAPALYMPDYRCQTYPNLGSNVTVVHGWSDTVVSPDVSIRYSKETGANLHLIEGDHRLNEALPNVIALFRPFLSGFLA